MASLEDIRPTTPFGLGFKLIHLIYQAFWPVFILFALLKFWRKGAKEPGYRRHIGERLGFYKGLVNAPSVWVHALSLGETRGVAPLVEALLAQGHKIILTHTTPAGRTAGAQLFADAIQKDQLTQIYIPFDFTPCVRQFFKSFKPKLGILMEADLWPGLIIEANKNDVPLFVVNARYPDNKVKRDQKTFNFKPRLFQGLKHIFAKTQADVENFKRQHFDRASAVGEMKFDINLDQTQLKAAKTFKSSAFTFVAASTREGEEDIILSAFSDLKSQLKTEAKLVIVPRSPQRFGEVAALAQTHSGNALKRSELGELANLTAAQWPEDTILIGDSLGEMAFYLGLADVVFVGGSMFDVGGHAVTEPLALNKPILMGPSQWGTGEPAKLAAKFGALKTVQNEQELAETLISLFRDEATRAIMAQGAEKLMTEMGGATKQILIALKPYLPDLQ